MGKFKFEIEQFDNEFYKCQYCGNMGIKYIIKPCVGNMGFPKYICKECFNTCKQAFKETDKKKEIKQ